MASSAMITVPTTASRFALLQIDSDSDSDGSDAGKTKTGRDGKPRAGKAGAAGGKAAPCNDKKKDKKKKRREQQQTEANEVSAGRIRGPSCFDSLSAVCRGVTEASCCFTSPEKTPQRMETRSTRPRTRVVFSFGV